MCFGSWNKINPFVPKSSQIQQFWNTSVTVSEIPDPYYDFWNNKVDIVILSFNKELSLLVHWWQRQAAVEESSRGDESAPDIPPAKPCVELSEAAWRFEVELRQHWCGCSYKARCFPWCLVGTNISSTYLLSIQILPVVDKVHIAVVGDASYTVIDTRPTTNVGMKCSPD